MNRHSSLSCATVFVIGLLLASSATVMGQAAARPNRGAMPTGSYDVSDIENISLTNGNLNIGIPLASLPPIAGGKLSWTLRAEYNSKLWDTVRGEAQTDPLDPATKYVGSNLQLSDNGGWQVAGVYSISFQNVAEDYNFLPPSGNDPEYSLITTHDWMKVVLKTPDGATHELRPVDYLTYGDGYLQHNYLRGYYKDTPHTVNASMRYYSFDGSHLWAKIDNTQYCCFGQSGSWTLYLPDGTKVEQLISGEQRITDTNGNKVKIFSTANGSVVTTHYQDELTQREIKLTYDPAGNGGQGQAQVEYQTVGGSWQSIVINYGWTHVFGKNYEFGNAECPEAANGVNSQLSVIRSIVYPQTEPLQPGRQFTFAYNSDTTDTTNYQFRQNCWVPYQTVTSASHGWGSLSQITMPTDAIVNYSYSLDSQHYLQFNPDDAPRESLATKTLIHDGTSDTWSYGLSPGTASVTAPDGSSVSETRYPSDPGFAHYWGGFGGKEELVYRTNNSNKVMVERHWTLMPFTGGENIAPGANVQVAFNPVVDKEYTSLLDDTPSHNPVKISAKAFQYDYNGNLLSETDYDWFEPSLIVSRDAQGIPMDVPGGATVLRVINTGYHNPANDANSGNVYAKRSLSTATPLILNAPKETTLGASDVRFSYDNQGWETAPTAGNLTTKSVWDDIDAKWITTSNTYDLYGNLATSTDARQKVTQYAFNDSTHALPTSVTVDPQNTTGTQTVQTTYDYSTGMVLNSTDVNLNISTIDYTNQLLGTVDPFGRPGIVYGPLVNVDDVNQRQRVTTTYVDSQRQTIVASDLKAENDKLLKTRTTADMLGRVSKTEQTEDGTNYSIYSLKAYDQMGKITYASSPMRLNVASNTDSWTRITNDNAGRVIEVATFAGVSQPQPTGTPGIYTGSVTTEYVANSTTVTDQAGKKRKSETDALSRLVKLYEDPNPGGLNYLTSYEYDVFGNLKTVNQGTQTRTFNYDSISRLRSAINPESGTISYAYDDNGNLLTRTDARQPNVISTYAYDALNRPFTRSYSDGTPTVTYTYDTPGTNSKGKLTSVSSSVSTYSYSGFDAMGRVKGGSQTLGGQTYTLSYSYDLAGHVKSITYPSLRTVNYGYDNAGRTNTVTGNLGGTNRNYSTEISYDAGSRMTQEKFGTTTSIYNKLFYTSRGQLAEIREGLTPDNTNWERGAIINFYGTCWGMCAGATMPTNNGNLLRQEHWIQNDSGQVIGIPTQEFQYDNLNRLLSVSEGTSWKQQYYYDQYGNRRVDQNQNNTFGDGIPKPDFGLDTSKNQLTAPAGSTMSYDQAGNLTTDTYTGAGNRTYDAENRITSALGGFQTPQQAQLYFYNGDGQRVRRKVDGVETWQVYGIDGRLLAEYAANGSADSPQKEYGYRNGELLVTTEAASGTTNLAANNPASQSSTAWDASAQRGADGNSDGNFGHGSVTHTAVEDQPWWQVDLQRVSNVQSINVWNRTDCCGEALTNFYIFVSDNPFTASDVASTQSQPGVSTYYVSGVGGTPSTVTVNRTGRYVRVQLGGYERLSVAEVEVIGTGTVPATNLALNKSAMQSSTAWDAPAQRGVDGNPDGNFWNGSVTHTAVENQPWWQVDLQSVSNIQSIKVWNRTDCCGEALSNFYVFVSDDPFNSTDVASTQNQPGVSTYYVAGQGGVPSTISVNRTGRYVRVQLGVYERLSVAEVQVFGGTSAQVCWLVTDQLGTPRMVFDQTGSLNGTSRHDYLPFGEPLFAAGRGPQLGYANSDGVRQQFTQKERDIETGLDYFGSRYYASVQGRFTGADPYDINFERQETEDPKEANALFTGYIGQPQHWNHYSYALNNPLKYVDPDGLFEYERTLLGNEHFKIHIDDSLLKKDPGALKRIQDNLQKAFDKINAGAAKLTPEQIQSIGSMKGVSVLARTMGGMNGSTYGMKQTMAENPDINNLASGMIHDSRHGEQFRRGISFSQETAVPMEMEASQWTVDVLKNIGTFDASTMKTYEDDAKTGHIYQRGWTDKSTPKSREKIFSTMFKPRK